MFNLLQTRPVYPQNATELDLFLEINLFLESKYHGTFIYIHNNTKYKVHLKIVLLVKDNSETKRQNDTMIQC